MSSTAPRMTSEQRRSQIVSVARCAFARGGYRTTTAQVALAAGVSEALVLKHFGSKDELFRAAIATPLVEAFEQRLRLLRERGDEEPTGSPRDHIAALRAAGHGFTDFISTNRELIVSLARDGHEFPDVVVRLVGLVRDIADELARTFARYATTDDYRGVDPAMSTYAGLGALVIGALVAERPHEFVDEYYDMIFHGLLSPRGRATFADPR